MHYGQPHAVGVRCGMFHPDLAYLDIGKDARARWPLTLDLRLNRVSEIARMTAAAGRLVGRSRW